eukprot:2310883-Rhodomonas_salina.1
MSDARGYLQRPCLRLAPESLGLSLQRSHVFPPPRCTPLAPTPCTRSCLCLGPRNLLDMLSHARALAPDALPDEFESVWA